MFYLTVTLSSHTKKITYVEGIFTANKNEALERILFRITSGIFCFYKAN